MFNENNYITEKIDAAQCMVETVPTVHKKKRDGIKKFTAVLCVTTLGFTGLGLGLGMGNTIEKLMNTGTAVYAETGSTGTVAVSSGNVQFMNSLLSAQGYSVTEIFKSVSDSIVSINCLTAVQMFNRVMSSPSAGSGIIFAEDDEKIYIATNNHVIEGASQVTISLDDENVAMANYVGSDYLSDLAVISVTKEELANAGITNYGIAHFGDSDALEIGEPAIAIGNALGEGKSATLGIVSATNKKVTVDAGRTLNLIQTDAAINPGNSGGALVNSRGEVIGINTVKIMETGVEGMGYSIPSNAVSVIIEDLMLNGMIQKPYLGIEGQTVNEELRDQSGLPSTGVYVYNVSTGSGAADGGLRPGDLIYRYNDIAINSMEDLAEVLGDTQIGETVIVYVYRNLSGRSVPRMLELEIEIRNQNATASF